MCGWVRLHVSLIEMNIFMAAKFNPYAAGSLFGQYKMIKKNLKNN